MLQMAMAIIIFKAHILSRLEYGSVLCIGANNVYLVRLQKLVNKSLRICFRKDWDANVFNMHIDAKILPRRVRHNIALMILMFVKILQNRDMYETDRYRVSTRGDKYAKLDIPFPKKEFFRRSLTYQGPSRLLALPNSLKCYDSMKELVPESSMLRYITS